MATKPKKAKTDTKPRQNFVAITQLGLKAQSLATTHAAAIGARLSPAFLTSFAQELDTLGTVVPAAITTRHGAVQSTAAQNVALATGHTLVIAARAAVRGQSSAKDVLLAYGVGTVTSKLLVKDVKTALQKIIDRASAQPAEAASFGIIATDVTAMKAAIVAIDAADKAQELARATAPATTKERNETAHSVLSGIKMIAGAGMLAFVADPTTYAQFEVLITKKKGS